MFSIKYPEKGCLNMEMYSHVYFHSRAFIKPASFHVHIICLNRHMIVTLELMVSKLNLLSLLENFEISYMNHFYCLK